MTNSSDRLEKTSLVTYPWEIVGWLFLAYVMNQADRQIFNVVLPLVKEDLGINDVQAGIIGSTFIITMALILPAAGYIGDRFPRSIIIVQGRPNHFIERLRNSETWERQCAIGRGFRVACIGD